MDSLIPSLIGAAQITLLDIVLSGDNIGVIALATRKLPPHLAKKASAIGVFAAVLLRIIFASLITYILMIEWLPIRLVGGLLLIKITWNFIRPDCEEEDCNVNSSNKFMGAIWSIIIADATMSLDNVLAIAGAAHGNIALIVFGLLLNIPIIFFGSQYVAKLMNKHPMVPYIGGAVLAHTSFKMLLEDKLLHTFVSNFSMINIILPYGAALLTIIYGFYITKKSTTYNFRDYKEKKFKI